MNKNKDAYEIDGSVAIREDGLIHITQVMEGQEIEWGIKPVLTLDEREIGLESVLGWHYKIAMNDTEEWHTCMVKDKIDAMVKLPSLVEEHYPFAFQPDWKSAMKELISEAWDHIGYPKDVANAIKNEIYEHRREDIL